jgi:hypothetical protein
VYAVLGLVTLLLLVKHVGLHHGTGIAVALGALGMSVLTDKFVGRDHVLPLLDVTIRQNVMEDHFKLIGWVAWFTFWTSLSRRTVRELLPEEPRAATNEVTPYLPAEPA